MVNDTSIAALFKPSTQSLHAELQQRIVGVFNVGRHGDALTRQQLAVILDKPINCITAPVKALLKAGLIVEHERVRNQHTKCLNWTLKLKESE